MCRRAVAEHGHLHLPYHHATDDGLHTGVWLAAQRRRRRAGRSDPYIDAVLDDLDPGWPTPPSRPRPRRVRPPKPPSRQQQLRHRLLHAATIYAEQHGHLDVPTLHITLDGLRLGGYLRRCRAKAAAGRLDPHTTTTLTSLDPSWTNPPQPRYKYTSLDAARQWHHQHGHLRIPKAHITDTGTRLGSWMAERRKQHHKNTLAPHIRQQLDTLDPTWAQRRPGGHLAEPPEHYLTALDAFRQQHGHSNPSRNHITPDGLHLGRWLHRQRTAHRNGTLNQDTITALTTRQIDWIPHHTDNPDRYLPYLDAMYLYLDTHGHVDIPNSHITDEGLKLGAWLTRQRHAHHTGTLPADLEEELNALRIHWRLRRPNRRNT